jgi:hypothetical protein
LTGRHFQYSSVITDTQPDAMFETGGIGNGSLPLNLSNQLELLHSIKPG